MVPKVRIVRKVRRWPDGRTQDVGTTLYVTVNGVAVPLFVQKCTVDFDAAREGLPVVHLSLFADATVEVETTDAVLDGAKRPMTDAEVAEMRRTRNTVATDKKDANDLAAAYRSAPRPLYADEMAQLLADQRAEQAAHAKFVQEAEAAKVVARIAAEVDKQTQLKAGDPRPAEVRQQSYDVFGRVENYKPIVIHSEEK